MIEKSSNEKLAGEKFSENEQCELVFGPGSQICTYMPKCNRLWCSQGMQEERGCKTQHMPWADGTQCGHGEWCMKGECVHINRSALAPVHGGWGAWSAFGECSRTCGGGVQSAYRNCDNPIPSNGGKFCNGQKVQYRSCNTQDCPDDNFDFRAEQCSRFDNNSFNMERLNYVKWKPKYGLDKKDECKLFCRADMTLIYYSLANKVIDGTPCSYNEYDKCINGACVPAGCDNELYSTAALDICGVCKGKNETCESYYGNLTYYQFQKAVNYHHSDYYIYPVVTIPKGATNLHIIQAGAENDLIHIALRDDHDEYILNSFDHIEDRPKTIYYGGITLDYNGGRSSFEIINSTFARQLKRELKIDIMSLRNAYPQYSGDENIITFSYLRSDPKKTIMSNHITNTYDDYQPPVKPTKQYSWQVQDWSNCSNLCQGRQNRKYMCFEMNLRTIVLDSYCRTTVKPQEEIKECNSDCRLSWEAFKSECSVTCGEGNSTISYQCVQRFNRHSENSKVVDKSNCPSRYETTTVEPCTQPCNEVSWDYSDWGPVRRTIKLS